MKKQKLSYNFEELKKERVKDDKTIGKYKKFFRFYKYFKLIELIVLLLIVLIIYLFYYKKLK